MSHNDAMPGSREFLAFLKTKFQLVHNSNFFFRDLHYGVMAYLASKGKHAGYTRSEKLAREIAGGLEREGIFKKIDHQSWCVNYPEFALPRADKTPAAAGA
jgi:hypothetical protein